MLAAVHPFLVQCFCLPRSSCNGGSLLGIDGDHANEFAVAASEVSIIRRAAQQISRHEAPLRRLIDPDVRALARLPRDGLA